MFSAKTSSKPVAAETQRTSTKAAMPSIISHQLAVHGDLASDGDIQVDGMIEGDVKTNVLTIGESGTVKGAITAETVVIAGTAIGQIRAKTVSLSRTARMQGDIWHESLAIEAGARFEGSCKHLTAAAAPAEAEIASLAKARRAVNATTAPAEGPANESQPRV
jgi:cytoskeletal protein CcmA (bactofilin family)